MLAGYARTESFAAAAKETFDPAKPCGICRAVCKAREASGRQGQAVPAAGGGKMVLIFERSAPFVALSAPRAWPAPTPARAQARSDDVPVPPPKPGVA
jgi:hypothetical protein